MNIDGLEPLSLTAPPNPKPTLVCAKCRKPAGDDNAILERHDSCPQKPGGFFVYWFDGDHVSFVRAGNCVCPVCHHRYLKHPLAYGPAAESHTGDPFLHVLCDGMIVKL